RRRPSVPARCILQNPSTRLGTWWKPLGVSRRDGSSCSLAIGGAAICVSARIFRIVFDRLAEFVSSGVKVFFLGKLDAALHMVSAAAFGRFRCVDLNCHTTKNRCDCDTDWLLV